MGTATRNQQIGEIKKDFYSPEEAYELVMKDVRSIYGINDAI